MFRNRSKDLGRPCVFSFKVLYISSIKLSSKVAAFKVGTTIFTSLFLSVLMQVMATASFAFFLLDANSSKLYPCTETDAFHKGVLLTWIWTGSLNLTPGPNSLIT